MAKTETERGMLKLGIRDSSLLRRVGKKILGEQEHAARKRKPSTDVSPSDQTHDHEGGYAWDDEQASAEEWYEEKRRREDLAAARIAANQRRDQLLPEDDR